MLCCRAFSWRTASADPLSGSEIAWGCLWVRLGCARGQNKISNSYSQFGLRGRAPRGVTGELSPASVYVSLLPVVEACVVVAVPGRVGEVRVAADSDEPEAVDLDTHSRCTFIKGGLGVR